MVQLILIASLIINVNYFLRAATEEESLSCYKCDAYEDFLEEWYRFDKERNEDQSVDEFQYELPPDDEMIEEPPTEEI